MSLYILFLILTNVIATLSVKNGSLTFVIDDTASMYPDIASVILGSKSIIDVIFKSGSSQIQDLVLVTFNDPDVKLLAHTKNRNIFENKLNNIRVEGGGDCPEMSLSGLELGLRESLSGSYVFLFTDDAPKDGSIERIERIKSLCQEKESHVVFVMTPNQVCWSYGGKDLTPYYTIANSSSGQVLRLDSKTDVQQIIPYINETVTGERTVITTKVVPSHRWTEIPFEIDDQTEYAVASTSGNYVQFRLLDENNVTVNDYEPIVWIENVKVVKINKPGRYVARVHSDSTASVVIFARTDFTFEPGFSVTKVKSFKDTEKQPYDGIETYLWISVNEPKHLIEIKSAEILDMNENLIEGLPLKKMYSDVYVTDLFIPPNSMFKVAVNGIVRSTGNVIKRFAKVPVESRKPRTGSPKIITQGSTNHKSVVGDKVLRIPCVAIGYPTPSITWLVNGKKIEKGDDYFIENGTLIIQKITKESFNNYTCRAENSHGKDEKNHGVDITNTVDNNDLQKKYILKNTNETLQCPLAISDTDSVRWFKNGYFDSEGPLRNIIDASSSDDGNYTCRVSNNFGSENGQTLEVIVDVLPTRYKYGKSHQIIKWKGGNNVINCGIDIYRPTTVKIDWLHNGLLMKNKNNQELHFLTWGNYTCRVSNFFGSIENNFLVSSEDCLIDMAALSSKNIPLILTTSLELPHFITNEHFLIVPQGTALKLFCNSFKRFSGKKEINAVCSMEDQYMVNDDTYTLSDFYCNAKLKTEANEYEEICAGKNTKLIKIGYNIEKFVKVFETCYDTHRKVPVYTKTYIPNPKFEMYKDDEITTKKYVYGEFGYNAKKNEYASEDPNCLYVKGPLTNAEDISFGVAQRAIFDRQDLNDVLYLSCFNNSNWKQLEESIRRFIAGNRDDPGYTIWSGTSKWEFKNKLSVPRYLWKVIKKLDSTESLAIVTVNDPNYSQSDRLCGKEDQCKESWIPELPDWPTYCCQLSDFSKAFNIPFNVFVNPPDTY